LKKKLLSIYSRWNDAFRTLNSSQIQIFRLERKITQHIPYYICHSFFTGQESSLHYFFDIQI